MFLLLGATAAFAAPQMIAFERSGAIWVAKIDGSSAKKVATGALPAISPDGTRVAFNTEGEAKTRPGPERHIAIVDLGSGKTTVLKEIPNDNCFGPIWSPDGKQLAFMVMAANKWQLGLVNANGSGFRFLKSAELKSEALGGQTWSQDDQSLFCHDLENIYHIGLDGNLLKKWELAKILNDAGMNSGNRLSISPDGRTLLMDVDLNADHSRKNWDGPQPAVYLFDLATEKATRVSGKNDFAWEPFWFSNDEFLCVIQKENEKEPSIYKMSIDGRNPKLIVKHARTPSASVGTP